MDDNELIAVAAVLLCALLNFFFTLAEASLVTMGRLRIGLASPREAEESLATDDTKPSANLSQAEVDVRELLAEPTQVIAAVQVAITLFSLLSLAITLCEFAPILTAFLCRWASPHTAPKTRVSTS